MVQNKVPKVDKATNAPAAWPKAPSCEWCPPGHGDLYAALVGSGKLAELREAGVKCVPGRRRAFAPRLERRGRLRRSSGAEDARSLLTRHAAHARLLFCWSSSRWPATS